MEAVSSVDSWRRFIEALVPQLERPLEAEPICTVYTSISGQKKNSQVDQCVFVAYLCQIFCRKATFLVASSVFTFLVCRKFLVVILLWVLSEYKFQQDFWSVLGPCNFCYILTKGISVGSLLHLDPVSKATTSAHADEFSGPLLSLTLLCHHLHNDERLIHFSYLNTKDCFSKISTSFSFQIELDEICTSEFQLSSWRSLINNEVVRITNNCINF